MTPETTSAIQNLFSAACHKPREIYRAAISCGLECASKYLDKPTSDALQRLLSLARTGIRASKDAPGSIQSTAWANMFSSQMADLSRIDDDARVIASFAFRRALHFKTQELANHSKAMDFDAQRKAASELTVIAGEMGSINLEIHNAATVIEQWAQQIDAAPSALQIPFGALKDADILLPKSLTLVGAYPGVGKTAFLATLARRFSDAGKKVFYLVLEDDARAIVERLIAAGAKVSLSSLKNFGAIGLIKQTALQDSAALLHSQLGDKLLFASSGLEQPTQESVHDVCERAVTQFGADVVLVDHLGEIRAPDAERHDLAIDSLAGGLRRIADTYRVPVVSAVHLRRREGADVDTKPRLTDIAFSSGLERKARLVFGLAKRGENIGLYTLKNTSGRCVNFELSWEHPGCLFSGDASVIEDQQPQRQQRGAA